MRRTILFMLCTWQEVYAQVIMKGIEKATEDLDVEIHVVNAYGSEADYFKKEVEAYEQSYVQISTPTLGEIILDALDTAGMTAKQLADQIGISPSRISDYIHNRCEPTLRIARQLCKILNISPAEMLGSVA